MRSGWEDCEDLCVMELYPVHGPSWDRWGEFLPGRSVAAITARAHRLGVRVGPAVVSERRSRNAREAAAARPQRHRTSREERADEAAPEVMRLMGEGLAPSKIDRTLGLVPGTAALAVTRAWRADAERAKEERA